MSVDLETRVSALEDRARITESRVRSIEATQDKQSTILLEVQQDVKRCHNILLEKLQGLADSLEVLRVKAVDGG